ncbi:alpha/beta hydrolase family protein [Streptomyces sp. SBT349]|uniref:alpha/beta hydrolase family protein n=1 Tax=Streptomyces sp. SBT349 TaxID=1580539 RepID=UPI00069DB7A6|nr:prolyl oligopeptidase family serine peptidase [Streptomyces sp. SBT349]
MTLGNAITGEAAGVPFTALPPAAGDEGRAPLVVTWHMLDAPRTHAAFAAALPLTGVHAWRVHLGLPWCAERSLPGGQDALWDKAREDMLMACLDPMARQAADEFPGVLAALRRRLPVDDGPLGLIGASYGGAVALRLLAGGRLPVAAVALVNAGIRVRTVMALTEETLGQPYAWSDAAEEAADRLDFVARAGEIAARDPQPPLLVVSGELDDPRLRRDAADLVAALGERYADPAHVRLVSVPGLDHPLAERPGVEPAPQLPLATVVDKEVTGWFTRHLRAG